MPPQPSDAEPEPSPPEGKPPEPVIVHPVDGNVGEPVMFDGSESRPGSSPVASFKWDFGDSSTGHGAKATHTYSAAGVHHPTLTITGEDGLSSVGGPVQITIHEAETPAPEPTQDPAAGLIGPNWDWTELNQDSPSVVPDPESYTLKFHEDRSLDFVADCNSGNGTYLVDGDRLKVDLGAVS